MDLENFNIIERFKIDQLGPYETSGITSDGDFFINILQKEGLKKIYVYPLNFYKKNVFEEHIQAKEPNTEN